MYCNKMPPVECLGCIVECRLQLFKGKKNAWNKKGHISATAAPILICLSNSAIEVQC